MFFRMFEEIEFCQLLFYLFSGLFLSCIFLLTFTMIWSKYSYFYFVYVLYCAPLYSTLLYSAPLYSTLLYSALLCSTRLLSTSLPYISSPNFSPSNIYISHHFPIFTITQAKMNQMAKLLPSAHIIILLRDPIIRAISEFDDNCKNGEYIRLIKPILIPYLTPKIEKSDKKTKNNNRNKLNIDENKKKEKEIIVMDGNKEKERKEREEEKVRMFFLPERSVMRMSSLQFI